MLPLNFSCLSFLSFLMCNLTLHGLNLTLHTHICCISHVLGFSIFFYQKPTLNQLRSMSHQNINMTRFKERKVNFEGAHEGHQIF